MRTIIVDDELLMLKSFMRESEGIQNLNIVGSFQNPEDALDFVKNNEIDLAIMDIEMPQMSGLELAKKIREINKGILIVFISAFEEYVRESNKIGADYYIVKPHERSVIEMMVEKMQVLSANNRKSIYIQMFGRFNVLKDGVPITLTGKAKEILALICTRRGKEISNEELYSVIWEGRDYDNISMKVYYNAIRRLKDALEKAGVSDILMSTTRGQMLNTSIIDCDYYTWQDKNPDDRSRFEGEFLSEYHWAESMLTDIMSVYNKK